MSRLIELSLFRKPLPRTSEFEGQLPKAIVDTVEEPLLVLDKNLRVVAASRSFYQRFQVNRGETQGRLLHELGNGQWAIPALRKLLEKIQPEQGALEGYEVEHEFPALGHRIMLVNARQVRNDDPAETMLLLAIEDVTDRRASEKHMLHLLEQKELLLGEMEHRVANSLQMIASMLMLKGRTVQSDETRLHLNDAYKRVMSMAAVQKHLRPSGKGERIAIAPYLMTLCESLEESMVGEGRRVKIETMIGTGSMVSSAAVSIGLIVTESVINSLKHAFNTDESGGCIQVIYNADNSDWTLSISDNGKSITNPVATKPGLGTGIVNALAQQLEARVEIINNRAGRTVSVVHSQTKATAPIF